MWIRSTKLGCLGVMSEYIDCYTEKEEVVQVG